MKQRKRPEYAYAREGLDDLEFRYAEISPGVKQVTAWTDRFPGPVGLVWYGFTGYHVLEVGHSYVRPWARRAGVRTAIHHELIRAYPDSPAMLTGQSSTKASRKWLKEHGFKKKRTGWWLELKGGT